MSLILPSWFKQRQGQAEAAGADLYRLTGPNLTAGYIGLRRAEDGRWQAYLRFAPDAADAAITQATFDNLYDAWEGAFELFRTRVVV